MFKALKTIFDKEKPDHPMSSADEARKILADLPKDDANALREGILHVESLVSAKGFSAALLHEVVTVIDDSVYRNYTSMWKLFATMPPKFRSESHLVSMNSYARAMSEIYDVVLRKIMSDIEKSDINRDEVAVTIMRQMRFLMMQVKLGAMRYRLPDQKVWPQLGAAIRLAEQMKLNSIPVQARRDEESNTISREATKILMLSVSPLQGLEPQEIDWAERISGYFSPAFIIRSEPEEDLPYCFDLEGQEPPMAIAKVSPSLNHRFFGAGLSIAKMSDLYVASQQGAPVPSSINTGENAIGVDDFQSLLNLLSMNWDGNASRKRSSRLPLQVRLDVAHGYKDVLRSIATSPRWIGFIAGDSTDREWEEIHKLKTSTHMSEQARRDLIEQQRKVQAKKTIAESIPLAQWETENVSSSGYGAISRGNDKWLAVNMLVAARHDGGEDFDLGVIRRLFRPQLGIAHVGVELWSKTPSPIRLKKQADKSSIESMLSNIKWDYFEGILLNEASPQTQTILVEPLAFRRNEECVMLVGGKESKIRMLDEIEHGAGFIRCSFEYVSEIEFSINESEASAK